MKKLNVSRAAKEKGCSRQCMYDLIRKGRVNVIQEHGKKLVVVDEAFKNVEIKKAKSKTIVSGDFESSELKNLIVELQERLLIAEQRLDKYQKITVSLEGTVANQQKQIERLKTAAGKPQKKQEVVVESNHNQDNATDDMRSYIEETVEMFSIKAVCKEGNGAALGRWLRNRSKPNVSSIKKWYRRAQKLRDNQGS